MAISMLYLTLTLAILSSIISGAVIILRHNTNTKFKIPASKSSSAGDFNDVADDPISKSDRRESTATLVDSQVLFNTSRPEFIPIKVPFLCKAIPYDDLGFWNYPARMGWEVHREDRWCHWDCPPGTCKAQGRKKAFEEPYGLARPAVTKKGVSSISTREKIAFLQAWLFFGALDEICAWCGLDLGQNITKTFVVDGMVTTQPLNGLSRRLYEASLVHWSGWAGVSKRLIGELLKIARYVQLIITRRTYEDEHNYTFEECLVLSSINITLRTMFMTILYFIPPRTFWTKERPGVYFPDLLSWLPEGQSTIQSLLRKQPLPHGWCSISELEGLDYDMKFFAYFLERPHALRDHSNCTGTRCLASQTDTKTYRTAHVSDACDCNFVAVDPERLKESLERNKIPKILVSSIDPDNATGTITLTIVDGEEIPYITISHVWADGLGNPHENSLPRCQLLRLRNLINDLGNVIHRDNTENAPIAFWLDTLCIPVAPHLRHYRTLAIHQIRETFRDATATLVLDRELYNLDSQMASNLEIGIKIFCGGWAKRIWTLKEAVYTLARGDNERLFFQMKEDLVEWNRETLEFKYHYRQKHLSPQDKQTFIWDEDDMLSETKLEILFEDYVEIAMKKRLPSLRLLMDTTDKVNNSQFIKLADAVNKRSTSKQEDEPLCLTFLLGRSAQSLLKTQDIEERMAMFYLELGTIPISVLFEEKYAPDDAESERKPWSKNNLLKNSPFRWAPASLAALPEDQLQSIRTMDYAWEVDEDCAWGTCKPDGLHIRNHGFLVTGKETNLDQSPLLRDVDTGEIHKLICYKEPAYERHREIGILFPLKGYNSAPILQIEEVRVVSEDQDACEYHGTIIGYGKIIRDWVCPEFEELEENYILEGRMLNMNQRWCIT